MAKAKKTKDDTKKKKDGKIKDENVKEGINGKKIKDNGMAVPKYIIPFYTKERWQNWIDQVKEINFKIDDQDKSAIFVYMTDDIVLSCLKLIAKYDKGLLQKEDANKYLSEIKEIVLKKIDPISEDTDAMLESTQFSLMGVFASCECYVDNKFERTKSFGKLIDSAIQAENDNNMGVALGHIAAIGANIIAGEKLGDNDIDKITSEGPVAEWLDGIDSISVAMIGDTSYRDDEPDSGD